MPDVENGNSYVDTDDYDIYNSQGVPESLPGSPGVDANGHLVIPDDHFFPPSTLPNSTMDKDPNNTGPITDFYYYMPVVIDVNGFVFHYDENTGINLRGPAGAPQYVRFSDLTEEEKESLKGRDGTNGTNGINGTNGTNGVDGLDAYHVWLRDNGYSEAQHPITEFYNYLAGYQTQYIREGTGQGSLIVNYRGLQNTAAGAGAFASGQNTAASGSNSFTAGLGTIAAYANQLALGKYNENKSTNIFEIGSGTSNNSRSNCLEVTAGGSLKTTGSITDGTNNVLSNKVDKIEGKGLSTNDFTDAYKTFLDNYTVDTTINSVSTNPVQNRAIYAALDNISQTLSSKPNLETGTSDNNYSLLSYRYGTDITKLENAVKLNSITWNPNTKSFKAGEGFSGSYNHTYGMGQGLVFAGQQQYIFGKYNTSNVDDIIQVGYGSSSVLTDNLLRLTKTGNLIIKGDVTDGSGNTLSGKQNILQYDNIPTQNSTKVMTSGAIYNTLVDVGITPGVGINIPEIETMQNQIVLINSNISNLTTRVETLEGQIGGHEITDDTTGDTYTIGINNGKFYIRKVVEPEPEEEEEVEGE